MSKKKKKIKARSDFKAPKKVNLETKDLAKKTSNKEAIISPKRNPLLAFFAYIWAAILLFGTGLICTVLIIPIANYLNEHFHNQFISRFLMLLSVILFIIIAKSIDCIATKQQWIEKLAKKVLKQS